MGSADHARHRDDRDRWAAGLPRAHGRERPVAEARGRAADRRVPGRPPVHQRLHRGRPDRADRMGVAADAKLRASRFRAQFARVDVPVHLGSYVAGGFSLHAYAAHVVLTDGTEGPASWRVATAGGQAALITPAHHDRGAMSGEPGAMGGQPRPDTGEATTAEPVTPPATDATMMPADAGAIPPAETGATAVAIPKPADDDRPGSRAGAEVRPGPSRPEPSRPRRRGCRRSGRRPRRSRPPAPPPRRHGRPHARAALRADDRSARGRAPRSATSRS